MNPSSPLHPFWQGVFETLEKGATDMAPVIADNDHVAHNAQALRGQSQKLPEIRRHAIAIRGNRGAGAYISPAG